MKKILVVVLSLLLMPFTLALPKNEVLAKDSDTLVIYSWEDYLDLGYEEEDLEDLSDSLLDRFSEDELLMGLTDIFEEEYGVTVEYRTFATNEEMYNELINNPNGPDLICPSEYMIMRMKDEGLIKPYKTPETWENYGSPYIKSEFSRLGLTSGEDKVYATGYMWGTMGYIFNTANTLPEELKNWDSILGEKFNKKVTIKDSIRDTYILAVGAVYEEELKSLDKNADDYSQKVAEIFNRTDYETLQRVELFLKDLKQKLYGFEVDSGKNDMISGKIEVNFAWSGDAVYTIDEAELAGLEFGYVVPEEGSNVWFDGWVMPNNANEDLATKFIDFVSEPNSAIRNMEYIGYTSCMAQDEVFEYVLENEEEGEEQIDLGYFFKGLDYTGEDYNVTVASKYGRLATQYPDYETIRRCTVMGNFSGDTLDDINDMWNRVKFITFPVWIIWTIVGMVAFVAIAFAFIKFKDRIFVNVRNKKKWRVVKKEEI
ncbi:MAG: extracellular solute-binding protein [Clostridiales bacterium]|nr:extracellular solute-binding protein [Clostridiales bacterium]